MSAKLSIKQVRFTYNGKEKEFEKFLFGVVKDYFSTYKIEHCPALPGTETKSETTKEIEGNGDV